jgi:hypothetical protein
MILNHWLLMLFFGLMPQAGSIAPPSDDGLTAVEREQLRKEQKIDNRIKIYDNASTRLLKTLEGAVLKEDFQSAPATLKAWTTLLTMSLNDIDQNESRKKKSKNLIRYEIHLRKAISDVQGFKIRAPADQENTFDSWLNKAEEIRKKLVDILFPG